LVAKNLDAQQAICLPEQFYCLFGKISTATN
jgi:hypothetical protein